MPLLMTTTHQEPHAPAIPLQGRRTTLRLTASEPVGAAQSTCPNCMTDAIKPSGLFPMKHLSGPKSPYFFNTTVPAAAWRQGDFSREGTPIKDPFNSGQPFPNNIIPSTRISNAAKQYLPFWPLPNVGDPNLANGLNFNSLFLGPYAKIHNGQVPLSIITFHRKIQFSDAISTIGNWLNIRTALKRTLGTAARFEKCATCWSPIRTSSLPL